MKYVVCVCTCIYLSIYKLDCFPSQRIDNQTYILHSTQRRIEPKNHSKICKKVSNRDLSKIKLLVLTGEDFSQDLKIDLKLNKENLNAFRKSGMQHVKKEVYPRHVPRKNRRKDDSTLPLPIFQLVIFPIQTNLNQNVKRAQNNLTALVK